MVNETVFKRYKNNPIVTPSQVPGANSIFNSAAVRYKDGYKGVFRIDEIARGITLHLGESKDGIKWDIEPEPFKLRTAGNETVDAIGYDPRVTLIDGTYYITWCYYPPNSGQNHSIGLGTTTDFSSFKLTVPIMLPYNRNVCFFPRKINGKFAVLHRPSDSGHSASGDLFYATSPDTVNWGEHRLVFSRSTGAWWENGKVGAGPSPIETDEGWLIIYHGVRFTCNGYVYCAGGAILDIDEPWKVKYRSRQYLLAPAEIYEFTGDVPNVVFPTATIVDGNDIRLYYGAADTVVGLATGKMDELISFIKKNS